MFKFHDDPTVKESKIIILLRHIWVYAGKREDVDRKGRKNEFER